MFAITDLIDPENEEVVKAIGIELFGDDSFTDRSYRAPGDSRAVLSCVVLSILAHAQATRCSKSLVNRDSPTPSGKWYCLK